MPTSSMEEIIGEADSEEESTEGSKCPYCSARYTLNPRKCEHLLCELFYAESNNDFVAVTNCPIVATLFGIEVPRVVAMRFIRFVREQRPPDIEDEQRSAVTTIKYISDTQESFLEWTYFLVPHPQQYMKVFESFVSKTYIDRDLPCTLAPFSCLQFNNDVMVFDDANTTPVTRDKMGWIMLTGLPDNLPIFLCPVEVNSLVIYVNNSDNVRRRMDTWDVIPEECVVNQLATLPTYLVN